MLLILKAYVIHISRCLRNHRPGAITKIKTSFNCMFKRTSETDLVLNGIYVGFMLEKITVLIDDTLPGCKIGVIWSVGRFIYRLVGWIIYITPPWLPFITQRIENIVLIKFQKILRESQKGKTGIGANQKDSSINL